jgi:ABC-2 type transport system permease protein
VLPDFWQTITLLNPIFYLVSGFRYSFFGTGEVNILISIFSISLFILLCIIIIWRIFKTGYKIKT